MADYYNGKGIIPEAKCFTNDEVKAFHSQLTVNGIAFPTPMDPDEATEVASWAKSLFLSGKIGKKNKKYFMLTTRSSIKPNLKELAKVVKVKELRLAQPKDMLALLHVEKGCVTAMTPIMDKAGTVTSLLDDGLFAATHLRMCAGCNDALDHSQHNISMCPPATLKKLLQESGHDPVLLNFDGGVKISGGSLGGGGGSTTSTPAPAPAPKKEKKEKPAKDKKAPVSIPGFGKATAKPQAVAKAKPTAAKPAAAQQYVAIPELCMNDEMGGAILDYLEECGGIESNSTTKGDDKPKKEKKAKKEKKEQQPKAAAAAPAPAKAAGGSVGFPAINGDAVVGCAGVLKELGCAHDVVQHGACVKTEGGMSSNEHHHEMLKENIGYTSGTYPPQDSSGHVAVSLFLKGKKKGELVLVVKRPATQFDMGKFGKSQGISGGLRFGSADQLMKSLGVVQDFVSPLCLVTDNDCTVRVILDASLSNGTGKVWLLPPGKNTESWGMSMADLTKFCSFGGRKCEALDNFSK